MKRPTKADLVNGLKYWRTAIEDKAMSLGTNSQCPTAKTGQIVIQPPVIRKLTPIEAERLQTIPDGYTEGVSNTQRYKAIGNGWTVDIIAHIFSFIK